MKNMMRVLAYRLTKKRINEKKLSFLHLHIKDDKISCFNLSTNTILSFQYDEDIYYFRECPKLYRRKNFFRKAVDDFFASLRYVNIDQNNFKQEILINLNFTCETVASFSSYIKSKMRDNAFVNGLSRSDKIGQALHFSIWERRNYDKCFFDSFGIGDIPEGTEDIAIYFLWCMCCSAVSYGKLRLVRGKEYSYFNAVRAISSRILAETLDLAHIITDAQFCIIHTENGREFRGVLSRAAPGMRMLDTAISPTGSLQQELGNLHLLDVLALQTDHGPNNYNVFWDGDGKARVCAFDNDNPMTFFPIPSISRFFQGCSPYVNRRGHIERPFVDKELAKKIESISTVKLNRKLKPYLNLLQRRAMLLRLKKLRNAIRKASKKENISLLASGDWDAETVRLELSGEYGVTYLTKAVESTVISRNVDNEQ